MTKTHLDCCIYFGAIINKNDLHNLAVYDGCNSIIEFIDKYQFDYRFIGNTAYSQKMIVGKEMHWDYGSHVTELFFGDNSIDLHSTLQLENDKVKIDNVLELNNDETKKKLKSSGITFEPKIYIITSKE